MAVYFIRAAYNGAVKIGYAEDVQGRLRELQCGNPDVLMIIRTVDGGRAHEAFAHRLFASDRIRGEWFAYSERMMTVEIGAIAPRPVPVGRIAKLGQLFFPRPSTVFEIDKYHHQVERSAQEAGIDLAAACKAEGVAATTLARWRSGQVTPQLGTTEKILQRIRMMATPAHSSEAA